MKYAVFFIIIICSFSFVGQSPEPVLITEGKCLGPVCLGTTTPKEIAKIYGKGNVTNRKKIVEQKKGYITIKWQLINYEKNGLSFRAGSSKTAVSEIEIALPFKAKTSKGIILGESAAPEIIAIYGIPEKRSNVEKVFYESKDSTFHSCCDSIYSYPSHGIDFTINCDTSFVNQQKKNTYENKRKPDCYKVKKIKIYQPFNF